MNANVFGNDDEQLDDENDDPTPGYLTSNDKPGRSISRLDGSAGDWIVYNYFFREFTRLKINDTWYRISPFYPWKLSFGFKKVQLPNSSGTVWTIDEATSRLDPNTN